MDSIGSKGVFQQDIPKLEEESQSLLREFDKFVSEIHGDIASDSDKNFRSLLEAHSEELTEHFKILSTIFHISSLFSSHSNLNEILSHIVQSVREVLNFTRVIILLLNDDESLLECKIMSGMSQDKIARTQSRPLSMKNHECIETKVARYGNSYLIKDINDPRLTEIDRKIIRNFGRGTTIYVPIISKKGIIGVLGVDRKSQLPTLKSEDVYRVQLFANYIGGLIENAKLYDSIIRHKNRFENIV
ncbi:MAG: GAF domain-containing protein, partial [Deltaproteobacteria bacterium]|nr:GAF domain-containing protein [Deltaproteobacteria bacterium]